MAQSFLHGVETVEVPSGPRTVSEVKTAVIGIVGIAPIGTKNKPILVKNDVDAAQFGKLLPGFDIPQALNFIFGNNAGTVIVVNVFDEALHTTPVVEEAQTVVNNKLKLTNAPIGAVTLKKQDGTPSLFVKGTDYTLDEYGNFLVIAGRIANGTVIKFDYAKLNSASITNAQIIGAVEADGSRSGMKAWDLSAALYGFSPKILIAPGYSATKAVADALLSHADKLRAVAPIDGNYGDDVNEAIEARGDATKAFGTSNRRAIPVYPYLKAYDINKDTGEEGADTNTDFPFSMFYAGLMAYVDSNYGYWESPSNYELKGVTGLERPITANLSDPDTDTNYLNAAGIVTVFNNYSTGWLAWGNRNASFPTNTQQDCFISTLRTFDVVHESLEKASLPFVGKKITKAWVDDILHQGNDFIGILIGRGALTPGSRVVFDKADNPVSTLTAGQAVFTIIKDAPSPAERITYKSIIDVSLKAKAL